MIFTAKCNACGKVMRKNSIKRHMYDKHYPNQQLPCKICNKLFKSANSLTTHLIAIHKQIKRMKNNKENFKRGIRMRSTTSTKFKT